MGKGLRLDIFVSFFFNWMKFSVAVKRATWSLAWDGRTALSGAWRDRARRSTAATTWAPPAPRLWRWGWPPWSSSHRPGSEIFNNSTSSQPSISALSCLFYFILICFYFDLFLILFVNVSTVLPQWEQLLSCLFTNLSLNWDDHIVKWGKGSWKKRLISII